MNETPRKPLLHPPDTDSVRERIKEVNQVIALGSSIAFFGGLLLMFNTTWAAACGVACLSAMGVAISYLILNRK